MLETDRLYLLKPDIEHLDALFQLHTNNESSKYTPKGIHENKDITKGFIKGWRRHWEENDFGYFMLIAKDTGELVGMSGFEYHTINYQLFLNLYYRLFPKYTGEGLATEAIEMISRWMKQFDAVTPKLIRTNQVNESSIKLAERLGYELNDMWNNIINDGDRCYFKQQLNVPL